MRNLVDISPENRSPDDQFTGAKSQETQSPDDESSLTHAHGEHARFTVAILLVISFGLGVLVGSYCHFDSQVPDKNSAPHTVHGRFGAQ